MGARRTMAVRVYARASSVGEWRRHERPGAPSPADATAPRGPRPPPAPPRHGPPGRDLPGREPDPLAGARRHPGPAPHGLLPVPAPRGIVRPAPRGQPELRRVLP